MKAIDFVEKMRSYLGTRYLHQGRVPATKTNKGGLDCVGGPIVACGELGYDITDISNYASSPDSMMFVKKIEEYMFKVEMTDLMIGDCLVFAFNTEPQHMAVVSSISPNIMIIHSYSLARKVVEHRLDDLWISRLRGAYRFYNLE